MKLFVGLGNPGAKHAGQRHNIGFMAVDAIHDAHGFPPWRTKFQGEVSDGRIGAERVMLLKPQTFMNLSGQSVGEAARFLKIDPGEVTVFHDELDLVPGKVRVKSGGGHAGHNGLRSLHQHLGDGYERVRIGIGHPGRKEMVTGYVLHDFAKADRDWIDPLLDAIASAAPELAAGNASAFQNRVAAARAPSNAKPREPLERTPQATPPPAASAAPEGPEQPGLLERLARHFASRD